MEWLDKKQEEYNLYCETKNYKKCLEILGEIIGYDSTDPETYFNYAYIYRKLKNYNISKEWINKCLSNNYMIKECYSLLGLNELDQNNLIGAESFFEKSLELDTNQPLIYGYLTRTYILKGEQEKAKEYNKKGKQLDPMNQVVLQSDYIYQLIYGSRENQENCLNLLAKNIVDQINFLDTIARYKFFIKDYKASKNLFIELLRLDPTQDKYLDMIKRCKTMMSINIKLVTAIAKTGIYTIRFIFIMTFVIFTLFTNLYWIIGIIAVYVAFELYFNTMIKKVYEICTK